MSTSNKKKVLATDIMGKLVAEKKIDKSLADEFVKVFISTIEDGIVLEKSVKIKGIGRLKVEKNDDKHKIVYKPDENLENEINAPFSHLRPVALNVPNFDKKEKKNTQEKNNDIEQREPLTVFQNQALEIKELLTEIGSINSENVASDKKEKVEEKREKVVAVEEKGLTDDKKSEISKENLIEKTKKEEEDNFDTVYDFSTKRKEEKVDEKVVETVEVEQTEETVGKSVEVDKENTENSEKENFIANVKFKKSVNEELDDEEEDGKRGMFWFFILLGLAVIVFLILFIPPKIDEYLRNKRENERLEYLQDSVRNELRIRNQRDSLKAVLNKKDTVANVVTTKKTAVKKPQPQPIKNIFSQPRKYTQFITVVKFLEGQNLAYLSRKYYGHSYFWVYIYEANRDKIANPNDIPVGSKLRIPKLNKKLIDKRNPKCLEYALKLKRKYLPK